MHTATIRPARALLHPLWWVALAALVLNDHWLKGAGLLPGAVTGKLSDVVGLLVAPAVLAVAVGVRTRRGLAWAHLATGAGLAAINLWPAAARAVERVTAATPFPWRITVDATDLWALPMLVVSWLVLGGAMARPAAARPALARLGLAVGAWACVATSPPPEAYEDAGVPEPAAQSGAFLVLNTLEVPQVVRVRTLRPGVVVSCAQVVAEPAVALDAAFFGPATAWQIEPGRELVLGREGQAAGCGVWRVDGPGLPLRDLVLPTGEPTLALTPTSARALGRALEILPEGWGASPWLHPVDQVAATAAPPAACEQLPIGAGLSWATPERAEVRVVEVLVGPDGCHRLTLAAPGTEGDLMPTPGDESIYICAGGLDLPVAAGDRVGLARSGPDALSQWLVLSTERVDLTLAVADRIENVGLPIGGLRAEPVPGCPWVTERCGGVSRAVQLASSDHPALRAGRTLEVPGGELTLVRADESPAFDGDCQPDRAGGLHLEWVLMTRRTTPFPPEPPPETPEDGGPPDGDLPDADLPDADLPDADLPDADLPDTADGGLPEEP